MSYEVQQTRWDRIVRRVSGSIGPGSRVSETLSELFPVLDVERVPGELLVLGGTALCLAAENRLAIADQFAHIQLFNPVGSNKLATITSVLVGSNVTQTIRWSTVDVALATATNVDRFRDTRLSIADRPVCQVRNASLVTVTDDTGAIRIQADSPLQLTDPNGLAVLSPGFGLEFAGGNVQSQIFVTFYWRERPAEESELNL